MKKQLLILTITLGLISCGENNKKPEESLEIYSQKMVESKALKTFLTNKKEQQLKTAHWDYVSGLVAYSVLKAWQQYPDQVHYYDAVKEFADHCLQGGDTVKVGESNIDDIAAGKIFFVLFDEEMKKQNYEDARRYRECAEFLEDKLKNHHSRIEAPKPGAGGFFHKAQYPNQMWLDGLYMGAAFYAESQAFWSAKRSNMAVEKDSLAWADIASQFKIIHKYTYDEDKKLNYHAWSADPTDANSFWARKEAPHLGCSPEFWGRGMGWYFAALVDVLEVMPQSHSDYDAIVNIVHQVAEGLALYQDEKSGCWYQLLQYNDTMKADNIGDTASNGEIYNKCDKPNYLESSASSMFTYAYLKGMRIGVLDKTKYKELANKAYQGLLNTFIQPEDNGDISIIQSCASAGLGPAKDLSRTGTINYYLCGKDVTITQNEGKAIGPFIMASLEYELSQK